MRYRMSFERLALEEGRQEGMRELLLATLQTRFGFISEEIRSRLNEIEDIETLRTLHGRALLAESLVIFEESID